MLKTGGKDGQSGNAKGQEKHAYLEQSEKNPENNHFAPIFDSTPALSPRRKMMVRYDLKVSIPPSDNPPKAVCEAVKTIISQLRDSDSSIVVYPWYAENFDSELPPLIGMANLPAKMAKIKKYFNGISPIPAGGIKYCKVFLGHKEEMSDILESEGWWMKNNNHGIWRLPLQVDRTRSIGWLLFSLRDMDKNILQEAISRHIKYNVGLRWKMINTGSRTKTPAKERVFAIHIEAEADDADCTRAALEVTYSSKAKKFPNGIRMRLVPEMNRLVNTEARAMVDRLRAKQAAFCENMMQALTWDFDSLDYKASDCEWTMRSMLMSIKSREIKGRPLIHSVDKHWRDTGFAISFHPKLEDEVRSLLAGGLLPFLAYKYGPSAATYFTFSARDRAQDATYDPERGIVISPEDDMVSDALKADPDLLDFQEVKIDMSAVTRPKPPEPPKTPPESSKMQKMPDANDNANTQYTKDSVGSFGGQENRPTLHELGDASSAATGLTMESRMSILEEGFRESNKHLHDIFQWMQAQAKGLPGVNPITPNPEAGSGPLSQHTDHSSSPSAGGPQGFPAGG